MPRALCPRRQTRRAITRSPLASAALRPAAQSGGTATSAPAVSLRGAALVPDVAIPSHSLVPPENTETAGAPASEGRPSPGTEKTAQPAAQDEADHGTTSGPANFLHRRVGAQSLHQFLRVLLGTLHAQWQGAQSTQGEERLEGTGRAPVHQSGMVQTIVHHRVGGDGEPHQQVAVATDELGAAVHHHRRSVAQGLRAHRRRERAVDHHLRARSSRCAADRIEVGHVERGVGGCLHPHHVGTVGGGHHGRGVGDVDEPHLHARLFHEVVHQRAHTEVRAIGQHEHPWGQCEQGGRGRRHARRVGKGGAALQRPHRRLERVPRGSAVRAAVIPRIGAEVAGEHDRLVQRSAHSFGAACGHGNSGGMHAKGSSRTSAPPRTLPA